MSSSGKREWNFFCVCSYDKCFCIKPWQKFSNLLLLCKDQAKNNCLKDVESTVVIHAIQLESTLVPMWCRGNRCPWGLNCRLSDLSSLSRLWLPKLTIEKVVDYQMQYCGFCFIYTKFLLNYYIIKRSHKSYQVCTREQIPHKRTKIEVSFSLTSSCYCNALRKHAYSNILKILPPKNEIFQIKNDDIFYTSAQNIDCGYSLEPPRRGGSNEYPQSMFWAEIKKIMHTPVNPSFTI